MRIVILLLGVGFLLQGMGWLVVPEQAAAGLGMPLLDGIGRSTQVGDFAAFFFTLGTLMLLGSRAGHARLLFVPAGMLGAAALMRTLAWLLQGASLAPVFITVEAVVGVLLAIAAGRED